LVRERAGWKRNGRRVVVAIGCFDLLHPGHVRLLEQARSLGDILVVAVRDDATVARGAGKPAQGDKNSSKRLSRPITPAAERAEILAALEAVDFVAEMDEFAADDWIVELAPDVLVQGGAGGADEVERREEQQAKGAGAKTIRIPLEPGHSTSSLMERIQNVRQPHE
jgi:rfaE bifunctional protein nucleotidyltransferase chain/domain